MYSLHRYITYTGPGFKEGIALTAEDEVGRQRRFAYGAAEMLMNRPTRWFKDGLWSPCWKSFWGSSQAGGVKWFAKIQMTAYLLNFFSMGSAYWGLLLYLTAIYVPRSWGIRSYLDTITIDPVGNLLSVAAVFAGLGSISSIHYR